MKAQESKMTEKIWKFIKEKWAVIAALALGFLAYLRMQDELNARKQAEEAAEKTRKAIEEAEKAERARIEQAQKKAEEEQKARDEKIKKESEEQQKKLEDEIKEKINDAVEKPAGQQAKDFADAFGGTYVKKED